MLIGCRCHVRWPHADWMSLSHDVVMRYSPRRVVGTLLFCALILLIASSMQNITRFVSQSAIQILAQFRPRTKLVNGNFNGYPSYNELISESGYVQNRQACEYGSLWQTTRQLKHDNVTMGTAAYELTNTQHLIAIPALPYAPNYRSPCFMQEAAGQPPVLRCLPYFFMAGFPKCGTTDIYKRMIQHPLIEASNTKEPLWFSRSRIFTPSNFNKYITKFSTGTRHTQDKVKHVTLQGVKGRANNTAEYHPILIGDFSTREIFNENTDWDENQPMSGDLIGHVMPCAKFIVSMRNPVERLYSDYIYFLSRNKMHISNTHFHTRVTQSIDWWNECTAKFPIAKCLSGSPTEMPPVYKHLDFFKCWQSDKICPNIRIGLYYYILEEMLKLFPRESFLILRMEDYSGNEVDVINTRIFPFLGLPPFDNATQHTVGNMRVQFPSSKDLRKRLHPPSMLKETRDLLTEFYRESNTKLAELLNDNRFLWNT